MSTKQTRVSTSSNTLYSHPFGDRSNNCIDVIQQFSQRNPAVNGVVTNGVSLPIRERKVDKKLVQRTLGSNLMEQMHRNRSFKDLQTINNFKEEVRKNQQVQQDIHDNAHQETHKKIQQREVLRQEMVRVLEAKRQQKLRAQDEEFKYYL